MSTYRRRLLASASLTLGALAWALLPIAANANPKDGVVVAGVATIVATSPATLSINQTSQKAVIDWRSFSIAPGELTRFNQPSSSSIALNRVTGGDPSQILGSLAANGQVWLINPNGIVFGKSARVDVAGLLATTLDINNQDFLAGNYRFAATSTGPASVTNAGHITIRNAGLAALVAPGVENSGIIEARLGRIQLSSANGFTVDFYGDGKFNFLLSQAVSDSLASGEPVGVTNSGSLIADGGQILLTAQAAKSVVDQSINMSGYIQARSVGTSGGLITLDGGSEGSVHVTGTIDASGKGAGQTGGAIAVTGKSVELGSSAAIDASGDAGGGSILIGGDRHGAGTLRSAGTTNVSADASLNADALTSGSGGQVVVWADDHTSFHGTISAQGGAQGGNGGSVEVSGRRLLDFGGTVDLRASAGATGTLLLDPENVTITATGTTPTLPASGPVTFNPTADDSVIAASTIQQALALADVTVTTGSTGTQAGDITVATNVSWSSGNTLTLSAYRNVVLNDGVAITNTGAGNLALRADSSGTGIGTVTFNGSGKVDFSASSGSVSIFYNPADNPAGSLINATSFTASTNYGPSVLRGPAAHFVSYMLVNTLNDLQNVQNGLSGDYALGRDIDASSTSSSPGFVPIGRFGGIVEGLGHSITNLTIRHGVSLTGPGSENYAALFSTCEFNCTLSDISIVNLVLTPSLGSGGQGHNLFVGGLVGVNVGSLRNVSVSGLIDDSNVTPPYSLAIGGVAGSNLGHIDHASANINIISSSGAVVGGLVGANTWSGTIDFHGRITASSANVDITFSHQAIGAAGAVGGLVGVSDEGEIAQSYANGNVVVNEPAANSPAGGLVGSLGDLNGGGSISDSYSMTAISGGGENVGGLVGMSLGHISNSFAAGNISVSAHRSGGLVGVANAAIAITSNSYWDTQATNQPTSFDGSGLTTAQLKSGLPAGFDPSIWAIAPNVNNGYPYLIANPPSGVSAPPPASTTVNFGNGVLPLPPPPPPPPTFSVTPLASGGVEIDISQSATQADALAALATSCAITCSASSLHDSLNTAISGLGALSAAEVITGNYQVSEAVQSGILKLSVQAVVPPAPPLPSLSDPTGVNQVNRPLVVQRQSPPTSAVYPPISDVDIGSFGQYLAIQLSDLGLDALHSALASKLFYSVVHNLPPELLGVIDTGDFKQAVLDALRSPSSLSKLGGPFAVGIVTSIIEKAFDDRVKPGLSGRYSPELAEALTYVFDIAVETAAGGIEGGLTTHTVYGAEAGAYAAFAVSTTVHTGIELYEVTAEFIRLNATNKDIQTALIVSGASDIQLLAAASINAAAGDTSRANQEYNTVANSIATMRTQMSGTLTTSNEWNIISVLIDAKEDQLRGHDAAAKSALALALSIASDQNGAQLQFSMPSVDYVVFAKRAAAAFGMTL